MQPHGREKSRPSTRFNPMQTSSQIESLLKRDRMVVVSGVVAVVAIAWAYTIYVAQSNAYTWMKTRNRF